MKSLYEKTRKESLTKTEPCFDLCDYKKFSTIILFFSFLEHVLTCAYAFYCEYKSIDSKEVISKKWQEKFKFVFHVDQQQKAGEIYHKLTLIYENCRNTIAHGFITPSQLYYDIDGYPFPFDLDIQYSFTGYQNGEITILETYPALLKVFDETMAFLENDSRFSRILQYICTLHTISFSYKDRMEYQKNIALPLAIFDKFIEKLDYERTKTLNYD